MPTTVFSATLSSNSSDVNGRSIRQFITPSSNGLGQVRATFKNAGLNTLIVDHASIALLGSATAPNTQNIPTELLFGGVSGFTITSGTSLTSDWLNFSFLSSDELCVILDIHAQSSFLRQAASQTGFVQEYFKAASASYNLATVTGYSNDATDRGILSIETQGVSGFNMPMLGM